MSEQLMAEEATGIRERVENGGPFYDDRGYEISDTEARRLIRQGKSVECPNAGAGSFRTILRRLGFKWIQVQEWCSSAGDWTFRTFGGMAWQENRYPRHGFRYMYSRGRLIGEEFIPYESRVRSGRASPGLPA